MNVKNQFLFLAFAVSMLVSAASLVADDGDDRGGCCS